MNSRQLSHNPIISYLKRAVTRHGLPKQLTPPVEQEDGTFLCTIASQKGGQEAFTFAARHPETAQEFWAEALAWLEAQQESSDSA